MSEQVTCRCGKTWLAPNARVGTLAGGGAMMKTFCFDCLTLLEVVDGAVTVTPMVPRVDSEAVKGTRLYKLLERLSQGPIPDDAETHEKWEGLLGGLVGLAEYGITAAASTSPDAPWVMGDDAPVLAAALAATGTGPSAEEMLDAQRYRSLRDATDGLAIHKYPNGEWAIRRNGHRWEGEDTLDTITDALIAQGGADRDA